MMDLNDPRVREIFFEIHRDLPREGPGDDASTMRALDLVPDLPAGPRILDVGCGPGMQTRALAIRLPGAQIVAVDNHRPFLRTLQANLPVAVRAQPLQGDMFRLPFASACFDLIWCEGAAYLMTVPGALEAWHPLLRPGGCVAFTEPTWTTDLPPEPVRRFWSTDYPDMADAPSNLALLRQAGYIPVAHFNLPQEAWWTDYYRPLEARLARLRERYASDPVALELVEINQAEIDLCREHGSHYAYSFFVGRKPD